MKSIDLVREFHTAFGQSISDEPHVDDDKLNILRVALLHEELTELAIALDDRDPTSVLDALTDLQYVLDGAYLSLGFSDVKDAALAEVHRSNMSKLDDDGQPVLRDDGKILKGPSYSPPSLTALVGNGVVEINIPGLAVTPLDHDEIEEWLETTGDYELANGAKP